MKSFGSLSFKFTMLAIAVLMVVFAMQAAVQVKRELSSDKETITSEALSFSSLSAKPLVDNYKIYYDSGFYKFKEISEKILALDSDLQKVQIINVQGKLLFDSDDLRSGRKSANNGTDLILDEVVADKIAGLESFFRDTVIDGQPYLEVIQPYVEDWGRHQYSVRYLFSYDSVALKLKNIILTTFFVAMIFFVISVIVISLFSRAIVTRPLNRLINAINDYARGAADVEKQIASMKYSDEIGRLATAFRNMISELSNSRRLIEQRAQDLEKAVTARTKELQSNIDELEKTSRMTVGRELKMVELKKRIEQLEKQLRIENKKQDEKQRKM